MKKFGLLALALLGVFYACSSEDSSSSSGDNYDRSALLANWADNIIIPSYTNFQAKVNALETSVTTFNTSVNQTNLDDVRTKWEDAYKAFQYVGFYTIGKAEEIAFLEKTNVYPINETDIDANISSGTYNLSLISQYDSQGFPALDYMLFGIGADDTAILNLYSTNSNYSQYLEDLVAAIKSNTDAIVTSWNGNYRNTFVNNNGNAASSSVNLMVNNFVFYYEKHLRAGKVGIPAGIYSNGTTYPDKVEASHRADFSRTLLQEGTKAVKDFFNGKHFNGTTEGASLKSYLEFLNAVRSGQSLATVINNQFSTIETSNATLNANFKNQIASDNTVMVNAFDALQQQVVYFKLDMMQALNITIDYVDADGD